MIKTNDFLRMLDEMRTAQRDFFATRSPKTLAKAKTFEKWVDESMNELDKTLHFRTNDEPVEEQLEIPY